MDEQKIQKIHDLLGNIPVNKNNFLFISILASSKFSSNKQFDE